jgi:uncharacterized membrane protein YidH (DUF202 family)
MTRADLAAVLTLVFCLVATIGVCGLIRAEWEMDRRDRGASLVEVALLLALIAVVGAGACLFLGGATGNTVNTP